MQSEKNNRMLRSHRSGFVLLLFLIIIAIGIIIYFVGFDTTSGSLPASENPASSHEVMPWEHEESLLTSGEVPNARPYEDQPSIENGIYIEATVEQSNTIRDFIVRINPDGTVQGRWNADYNKGNNPRMNYVMSAEFEGNIDPTVIFFDENGDDPTKLFMIAKGDIHILETNFDNGKVQNSLQDIWISGWVDKDKKAKGRMLLITGRQTYQTFNWKASQSSKKRRGLF